MCGVKKEVKYLAIIDLGGRAFLSIQEWIISHFTMEIFPFQVSRSLQADNLLSAVDEAREITLQWVRDMEKILTEASASDSILTNHI